MPGKKLDLTGQRFGKLVATEIAGKDNIGRYIWKCICDCGNEEFIVNSQSLVKGNTKSCGCIERGRKVGDLTGQKFGRLLVIGIAGKDENGMYMWKCECDCGNKDLIVYPGNLINGSTKSCGCYRIEIVRRGLESGEAAFNSLWSIYKAGTKSRELDFLLSKEDFKILTQGKCSYCGRNPEQIIGTDLNNGTYTYNGIDRIDSNLGYMLGNVVSCCGKCNIGKRSMTTEEFLSWIKSVYEYSVLQMI